MTSSMEPPKEWPPQVVEKYKPVRKLGKGGFASVVLAKRKEEDSPGEDAFVAIKVVAGATKAQRGYAHRETDILRLLRHPNMMRLIEDWEPKGGMTVMALSYARGPTLESLLRKRGAPSLAFGRVVSAQLVDVVAFLHSHAVLHRDIKPDNLVVTGVVTSDDDDIWGDALDSVKSPPWKELCGRWHVTLIDFGFARALGPDNIETDIGLKNSIRAQHINLDDIMKENDKGSYPEASVNNSMLDNSLHRGDSLRKNMANEQNVNDSRHSVSRLIVRTLSAVGHRHYAAPEIIRGVRNDPTGLRDLDSSRQHNQTLSSNVSDYGMVADAFSVGSTIRYTLTGVPPQEKVEDFIAAQNSPIALLCGCMGGAVSSGPEEGVKKRYRGAQELPRDAVGLIKGMTHFDARKRITVRSARLHHWVDDIIDNENEDSIRGPLRFLSIGEAMPKEEAQPTNPPVETNA